MDVFEAAQTGDLEGVRAVGEHDAGSVDVADIHGRTTLLWAVGGGHVEVARCLLDHGATVNHRDDYQDTALHWACSTSHAGLVSLLLERGADATAVDNYARTPLVLAARDGGDAVVRVLLEHGGSDVDAAVTVGGRRVIGPAAEATVAWCGSCWRRALIVDFVIHRAVQRATSPRPMTGRSASRSYRIGTAHICCRRLAACGT